MTKKAIEPRVSVRVTKDVKERLKMLESKTGVDEPTLVRACVEAVLDYFEANGHIIFPVAVAPREDLEKLLDTEHQTNPDGVGLHIRKVGSSRKKGTKPPSGESKN